MASCRECGYYYTTDEIYGDTTLSDYFGAIKNMIRY
jgi:hypothetical protein